MDTPRARARRRRTEQGTFASKLEEATDKIVAAMRAGTPINFAAAHAGISRASLHDWLRRGRDGESPFDRFTAEVDQAMGDYVVGASAELRLAGQRGDTKATMFMLERRFPEEFGRRQVVEHGNANGEPFRVEATPLFNPDLLTAAELDQLIGLLEKARPSELPVVEARVRQLGPAE